ncbi:uncharacterized protein LOC142597677 [Dermatophagoides farinae]|uniref:uncharacterized protein LOC142597677 n=1 Tax=Dermatophagoides farinae TaxID=6954 RepID=UPI003F5E4CF0
MTDLDSRTLSKSMILFDFQKFFLFIIFVFSYYSLSLTMMMENNRTFKLFSFYKFFKIQEN